MLRSVIITIVLNFLLLQATFAQLGVTGGYTGVQLVDVMVGQGVIVSNITVNCPGNAMGYFDGTTSNLGLPSGALLTTGSGTVAIGPNNSASAGACNNSPGNPALNTLAGATTYDACTIEFDIIPSCNTITISYIFGSEEYPEFVNSGYNDAFAFFISGPGITGNQNVAIVPGTTIPVTIDDVNGGTNSQYYVNNTNGTTVQYDGFTTPLQATISVTPCQTYHLTLTIADAGDCIYDSGVFMEENGIECFSNTVDVTEVTPNAIEGCSDGLFRFCRTGSTTNSLTVNYSLAGSATNSVDYANLPGSIVIPAGQLCVDLSVSAFADGITEGLDSILLIYQPTVCPIMDTAVITITDQLVVNAGPDVAFCSVDTVTIGIPPVTGYTYSWLPVTGLTDPTASMTQLTLTNSTSAPLISEYVLYATYLGCTISDTITATVNPLPIADFNHIPACSNAPTMFTDASVSNSGQPLINWQWDFGDGSPLDFNQNPSHIYSLAGTYNVTLTVTNSNGCVNNIVQPVTTNPNPVVDFNYTSQCEGTTMPFSDNSVVAAPGFITNWNWDFGDGTNANGANPSHIYTAGGIYNVTLIVTTNTGCIDSITKPVTVFFNPMVGFTHNDVCFGNTMNFNDTSSVNLPSTITDYLWAFGDGSPTSSLVNPSHNYSNPGVYNVTLIATTDSGCSYVANVPVNVYALPIASFNVNNVCVSDSAVFNNTSSGSIVSWSWNFGDGSSLNTSVQSPSYSYANAGTYTVTLITYSTGGCSDTATTSIEIYPMPVADFSFSNVCFNDPINFSDLSQGSISYWNWSFGDNVGTSNLQNSNYTYTISGNYDVNLTVTTGFGCTDSIVKNVVVYPLPVSEFNAADVCFGSNTQFQNSSYVAAPNSISAWQWNFDDGSLYNTTENPVYQYSSPGTYNVQLHITTNNGCLDSLTVPITVNPNPVVSFEPDSIGCSPLCVNFRDISSINSGSNEDWAWDFGDGTISNLPNPSHCYINSSNYSPLNHTVTLTVTSNEGCSTTEVKKDYITVNPLPIADFIHTPQETTIENPILYFQNQSLASNSWQWNFGENLGVNSIEQNPYYSYTDTDSFEVTLIAENIYACKDTIQQTVLIGPNWAIYIPNAFTPNSDGINDMFSAKGYGIKEYEMFIYNRWGELIFTSPTMDIAWDGTYKGNGIVAKQEVYVYLINIKDIHGKLHKYTGTVTLVK